MIIIKCCNESALSRPPMGEVMSMLKELPVLSEGMRNCQVRRGAWLPIKVCKTYKTLALAAGVRTCSGAMRRDA